jgi:hypothetical protein
MSRYGDKLDIVSTEEEFARTLTTISDIHKEVTKSDEKDMVKLSNKLYECGKDIVVKEKSSDLNKIHALVLIERVIKNINTALKAGQCQS